MRRISLLVSAALVLAATLFAKSSPTLRFNGQSWWDHVRVLADDTMEGRDTGSLGLRKAEAYVVERLKGYGLQPAGTGGFYQPVKFIQRAIDEKKSSASLLDEGKEETLVLGEDAYFSTRVEGSDQEIAAPLVFAGNGLRVPESKLDEFSGLDLHGKMVVYLAGSPSEVPGSLAAQYGRIDERWKILRQAGAVGIIVIPNPASMDIPWSRMSLNRAHPSMDLADPEFNEIAGLKLAMIFNPESAEKLFAGSGHTFAEIAALGKDRKALPHFPLSISLKAHAAIQRTEIESANIVAKLPGSDSKLRNEYVVLSAHLDHVGIGEPVAGDRIYNGAMDDGSGSALLLDFAALLGPHGGVPGSKRIKLGRSVLFVFFTAEEKGLLGSRYFAARPTVPGKSMIADLNTDMFLPIIPLKVLRVQGIHDSTLGDRAAEIAKSLNVKAVPDPEPLRNLFVRSDQYNFIRRGIPSVIMDVFAEPGTAEAKTLKEWLTYRYHAPSDDVNQPVDLHSAALYEEIVLRLLAKIANSKSRPQWHEDSFFRRYAANDN
jgi:Zn-dependent M28 family amino/carboxypeptidase